MNIFVTSADTVECAQALDDLRLNKMIIETAQILSTAMRFHGSTTPVYKSTHANHPCAIWARETEENYRWLLVYLKELCIERQKRTGKGHKTYAELYSYLVNGATLIPHGSLTPWPNCSRYKNSSDVHAAYKQTLRDKWANDKRPPKWTNSQKPYWA